MEKAGIVALIIGIVLTLVGAAIVFFVFLGVGFDFSKLNYDLVDGSSQSYVTKTYDISEEFGSIYIEDSSADIYFEKATGDKVYVESYERDDVDYDVEVNNKTLYINRDPKSDLQFFSIGINTDESRLTVYLPKKAYDELTINTASSDIILSAEIEFSSVDIDVASGDVSVDSKVSESISVDAASSDLFINSSDAKIVNLHTASGEITVSGLNNCEEIEVSTASGEIDLTDIKTKNINCSSSSGEQSYNNVVAYSKMELHSGSGEIKLYSCDAQDIIINTASGEVYGELLSKKKFVTDTASGDIDIAHDAHGENGECNINTASGDITIRLSK